jgi:hypothetical protein
MTKTVTASPAPSFTGKGKTARSEAFASIAPRSFAGETSRIALLATVRLVLGDAPSDIEVRATKGQWIIGRVAARLPESKVPLVKTDEQRLARAADLVLRYAKPAKEGAKKRDLRAGQIGRRTATEQRIVRAAEEACSVFFAELNLSNAKTNAERDKAKKTRAPSMAGSGKGKKGKATPPSHAQLVAAPKPLNEAEAINHLMTQSALLLQFANKYAKLLPTDVGTAVQTFKSALNKAASAAQLRRDAAEAKKAEQAK